MTDDGWKRICNSYADENQRFADRIEKLESALHQWDDLINQQFTGSRAAMSDMTDAAGITAALLHGDAPWPEPRIQKLKAALRSIAANVCCDSCREAALVARKALDAE